MFARRHINKIHYKLAAFVASRNCSNDSRLFFSKQLGFNFHRFADDKRSRIVDSFIEILSQ